MPTLVTDPLALPCGARLRNRLAKAAITEGLADPRGWPTAELERLYRGWAQNGFGLMITGNVIVDGMHLERPGNVIIDREPSADQMVALRSWTQAARTTGGHLWAQLSHSGRQTQKSVNPTPLSPSAVAVGLPGGLFGTPTEMTVDEIELAVAQFALAADVCKRVGFTGVQIHAAHGYLISCFLSPITNVRTDMWGGSLENRARFLLATVAAVRDAVGPTFPISVKLNSADFQRGGFSNGEALEVAQTLEAAGVDLLEVSGGTYESPAMVGSSGGGQANEPPPKKASTLAREAYFLDFARGLRARVRMPIMLTGGVRTREGAQGALAEGIDVLGIARPVCVELDGARAFLAGTADALPAWEETLRRERGWLSWNSPLSLVRTLTSFATIHWFYAQLYRLGRGRSASTGLWPGFAMLEVLMTEARILRARNRYLRQQPALDATAGARASGSPPAQRRSA